MKQVAVARGAGLSVAGKWSGTAVLETPGGQEIYARAYAELSQEGASVTGSAGNDIGRLLPIQDGRLRGNTLHLQLTLPGDKPQVYQLKLVVKGDRMEGKGDCEIEPGKKAVVTLVLTRDRQPEVADSSTPISGTTRTQRN